MKNGLMRVIDHLRKSLDPIGISDGQLLTRFIAERDEAAFSALVRRHGPMVLGVCRRILGNAHDTDDAFQATFLVLVQKARSVLNHEAIGSWLHTVACRSAQQAKVRNMRRQHRERVVDGLPHALVPPPEPNDWQPLVDEEVRRLPEKYRSAIVLCDLEGRPRKEAARQLHLAEGTLSSRLCRGRQLLAQRLTRRGITLSGGALAMSLSKASACVPPALVGMTTKAALLVAAGRTAALSASLSEILKGATQAMLFAKLKPTLATVMAIVLGAGTVVYCASGQTGPAVKPPNELEALRHENELLKINLRVTLEKIKALEMDVGKLKSQAKVGLGPDVGAGFADLDNDGFIDIIIANEALFKNRGDGTFIDVTADQKKALERAMKVRPDEMESALKLLRTAKDDESRQRAVDQMEQVMKKLREEVGARADKKK
jgi:RNA polymerase sigma factor (sigma-70 family)